MYNLAQDAGLHRRKVDQQQRMSNGNGVSGMSSLIPSFPTVNKDFDRVDPRSTDAARTAITSNRVNELYGSAVFGSIAAVPPSIPALVGADAAKNKKAPVASPAAPQHLAIPLQVSSHADTAKEVTAPLPIATAPQHTLPTQVTDYSEGHFHLNTRPAHPIVDEQSAASDRSFWDWTARVEFKQHELGTSFSVLIFLGQVPENPREWRVSPNFVGAHHAFVHRAAANRNQQDLVVEGFVHLNQGIAKHSGLASLEPSVVEPYLTNNLNWRVQKSNGEEAALESLEVVVFATPMSFPPGSIFPVPGQATRYNRITYGRAGGSRQA